MKHKQQPTPAALYARVSSDRQDVDLSVSAQLRALRDYAEKNGYAVVREYVDEAESGCIADRPQFWEMIEEAIQPELPISSCLDPSNAPSSTRAIVVSLTDAVNHPIKLTKPSLGVVS